MWQNDSLISKFVGCNDAREAVEITDTCEDAHAFLALVDMKGSYLRVSRSAQRMIGYDLDRLQDQRETIFSMASAGDQSDLFKAYSSAIKEGESYRLTQHVKCWNWSKMPVVTHLKKVQGDSGNEMILCLNVKA